MNAFATLLIEDDENDIFFFERALKKVDWGGELRIVRDGREAIAYLTGAGVYADRAQHPVPRLVVLDLNLPVKTGLEVLQSLRRHDRDNTVPVVVLTSSTSEVDMREAYRLGANSYFNKPRHPDELIHLLQVLKDYWLRYNQTPPPSSDR